MPRHIIAVRKASRSRLLYDFRSAARLVQDACAGAPVQLVVLGSSALVTAPIPSSWARGFVLGAAEATGSLTMRAALLTAWGE